MKSAFDEPLSYRLESYEFRVLSSGSKGVKKEKFSDDDINKKGNEANGAITTMANNIDNDGDIDMNDGILREKEGGSGSGSGSDGGTGGGSSEDEIEAVIDYVFNDNCEYGEIFNVYRIKWKGFGLFEATWEPKDHLNDAKEMIERYNQQITRCNPNAANIRNVRKSPFDNNLLHDLWAILHENGNIENNEFGVIWSNEGRAFQINNEEDFLNKFLTRNEHNVIDTANYDSFSKRMTILGFEQEKESKLYHHPCFNDKSNKLIDFIGKNSIPLPDDDEKAALFKSRVAKEKQEQVHPVIDVQNMVDPNAPPVILNNIIINNNNN